MGRFKFGVVSRIWERLEPPRTLEKVVNEVGVLTEVRCCGWWHAVARAHARPPLNNDE